MLIRIAALCSREMKRPGDMVARYGGEEFVVVMPSTDREGALQVARAIAEAVRNAGIAHRAAAHGVLTVSIGIATQLPTVQGKEVLLIADADQALYAAKRVDETASKWHFRILATGLPGMTILGDVHGRRKRSGN